MTEVDILEFRMIHQRHKQGVEPQQRGEAPFFQLFDKAADVARVADQDVVVAIDHHAHAVRGEGIDMVERQGRDHDLLPLFHQRLAILALLRQAGVHLLHIGHQVAVGQHRALGHPGGAAGVLQHGDIGQLDLDRLETMAAALTQHLLEGLSLGQVVVRHHLLHVLDHAVDQPALEAGQHIAHARFNQKLDIGVGQHFLHQAAEHVEVHQRTSAGVLELVTHLPRGVQRVGVDHDQAGAQSTKHGDRVLQNIGHLHGDTVARLEVGVFLQVGAKGRRETVQFGVGQGHAHIAERRTIGKFLAGALKHFNDGFVLRQVDLIGHSGRAFIIPELSEHYYYLHRQADPRARDWLGT